MAYDRIDWHSGGNFPKGLAEENGGIHIGMFLAWMADQNMIGEFHHQESSDELNHLTNREITGLQFLITACDGKFWEEDLNDQGNAFAIDYYDEKSPFAKQYANFMQDYCDVFNHHAEANGFEYESVYHVENTWENFDCLKPILDQRFKQWKAWVLDSNNQKLDPKVQFLHACQGVGKFLLSHGFKSNKAGTVWKKTATDKDTVFEVSFSPERYNTRSDVRMTVDFCISSKTLKKWQTEMASEEADEGHILFGALRRPDKYAQVIVWQVASSNMISAVNDINQLLKLRIFPLITLFSNRIDALEHLALHGSGFLGVCEPEATPLAFVLCFGTKEQAQHFFTNYLNSRPTPWRANIYKTFAKLQAGELWQGSAYSHEREIKLAFKFGLKLPYKS